MAVTSLWHIKGKLGDLISYVENPEKTVPKGTEDFFNVFAYVQRADKTKDEYVTSINCARPVALQQMILTKKQYGKDDGYIAWHGYQSFKVGEVSPGTAHEIGVKLAKELWGDRFQIIVTTHLDKDHIHNHFCFNSVSFKDGEKYNYSKAEQKRLRDASDRLCLEYGLSVIQKPHKAPSRPVWIDEKNGEPTRYNVYREDLKAAFYNSKSVADAEHYLNRLGYVTDFSGKHWKLQLPQYTHFTRTDTLDESWTPEGLVQMLGSRTYLPEICFSPHTPHNMRDYYTPFRQTSHLYRLYIYFCFQLGIIPKNEYYEPKSPYLKEELRKLDSITAQMRYMEKYRIETVTDLLADRSQITGRLTELTAQRTKMQNRIRRASPEEKKEMQEEKTEITKKISALRKELKTNYDIESYAKEIQEKLDMVADSIDPSWRREVQKAMAQNNEKKERDYER